MQALPHSALGNIVVIMLYYNNIKSGLINYHNTMSIPETTYEISTGCNLDQVTNDYGV